MDFHFWVWYLFRVLLIVLIVVFLISGLDDLFIDLLYYARWVYRRVFLRGKIRPLTVEQLNGVPEQPIAILIPAWDESAVISRMLLNTIGVLNYKNYRIFVGTYPNDEATRLEVEKVREVYGNVSAVVTPQEGPTNKSDCLNWIYQAIRGYEQEHNCQFAAFLLHDAEDIVHPLSLKYINYLIPRMVMIQLPVFAMEVSAWHWVSGVYVDEFAENHTISMRVRESLATSIPSAGVGTALSRAALDFMAEHNRNQIFDVRSLTEDYCMGIQLGRMSGKKIFLQQSVERIEMRRHWLTRKLRAVKVLDPIATREYFPSSFRASVRQKSRWIVGIALQGWRLGWSKSLGTNYFLFRDRRAVVTNLCSFLGYFIVAYWGVVMVVERVWPDVAIPPLIERGEIYFRLTYVVSVFLAWRVLSRMLATGRLYGVGQGIMAFPRLIFGNFLNFCATCQALTRFYRAKRAGVEPAWLKTDHVYPSAEQLSSYHRKLGDLLMDRRFITPEHLQQALEVQRQTGQRLGEVLVGMGVLWEEDLVFTLAQMRKQTAVEIDPLGTPPELLSRVPLELARERRIFPLAREGERLILATDNLGFSASQAELEGLLQCPLAFRLTTAADMDFAFARAYGDSARQSAPPVSARLGARLVSHGKLSPEDLKLALRKQKRSRRRLGDILVESNLVTPEDIRQALEDP